MAGRVRLMQLDFGGFDAAYRNDEGGRAAIAPARLTAVWILALLRGVTSSVELARADLLPGGQIAVDGSVVRAASSCKASKSRKGLRRRVEHLGEVIESKLLEESSQDSAEALRHHRRTLDTNRAQKKVNEERISENTMRKP